MISGVNSFGSSPHTRGTPLEPHGLPPQARFIPAYAGNAAGAAQIPCPYAVHPRIRGERYDRAGLLVIQVGSSPHTRGTLGHAVEHDQNRRFIPAYAGNAHRVRFGIDGRAVHPRIRGERCPYVGAAAKNIGSSPHTRGTRHFERRGAVSERFIPAYAGNAKGGSDGGSPGAVHPRIRGERLYPSSPIYRADGSSPHTRGTLAATDESLPVRRFIPAYAGNASSPTERSESQTVHPRIRGERKFKVCGVTIDTGSSPHTRGTLQFRFIESTGNRFIPAYAGNALPVSY